MHRTSRLYVTERARGRVGRSDRDGARRAATYLGNGQGSGDATAWVPDVDT